MNNQTVGNVGLYYTCYRLSRLDWNVMPTSRNARGIDILAYSQDGWRTLTLQVKSLSKRNPVPLGGKLEHWFADFLVICRYVGRETPECFVLKPDEVRQLAQQGRTKDGKSFYWLPPRQYESDEFREAWEQRIGWGSLPADAQELRR